VPLRRVATFLALLLIAATAVWSGTARADSSPTVPEERPDIAVPSPEPADTRPAAIVVAEELTVFAAIAAGPVTEDFRYDMLKLKGRAYEVCSGRLLPGSGWTFNEIVDRFGGTAGTMYSCRERWDAANDPDCNGTVSNSSSSFYSTCWSNHAAGRAIDVMVGTVGGGYNTNRGLAIINWLLARDTYGNVNANARRLGVQQILFHDRCWNSEGDRGIATWQAMRQCGIGHHDHIHIDMTLDGANGNVSYWGRTPRAPAPKFDTQALFDFGTAWREAVSWRNLFETDEEGVSIPAGYNRTLVGDWDGDRVQSEVFLWNTRTGDWIVQEWNDGDSLNARMGRLTHLWDDVVAGDFDNDGAVDDMIFWDRETGTWVAHSWYKFATTRRATGKLWNAYDDFVSGDFDGDGLVDDTLIWDHNAGYWRLHSWHLFRTTFHNSGRWPTAYNRLIVGDWNAGGDMDEALLWNSTTGQWLLQKWTRFSYRNVTSGRFGNYLDSFAPGDYDTDGRVDDLYVYDAGTGRWWIYSFHRYVMSGRRSGTWNTGFDEVSVGALNQ
jgi:hypothetical protein